MNIYISILKALLSYNIYNKYFKLIDLEVVQKSYPELYRLFAVLTDLHRSAEDKTYTPLDLKIVFETAYPKADKHFYEAVFNDIAVDQADQAHVAELIRSLAERHQALGIAKLALKVHEGHEQISVLKEQTAAVESQASVSDWRQYMVTSNIAELFKTTYSAVGLRWRLDSLNKSLGSLRKGDFGFVFARPETGKTTLLASEMSFMADQLKEEDGPIVWFNNEEVGGKVMIRCIQSVLGITAEEARTRSNANPEALQKEFNEASHDKLLVIDLKPMTKAVVEEVCRDLKPSVIIFDQIDKIQGFQADRNDLELKELYGWARELASQYGPVIAVCQAGGSGENKEYLTMNDVDSSKTSKQGEADWILGVGFVHDLGKEQIRYMHLSKNKLFGDEDTDPSKRHGKWACFIKPELARYQDFKNDGTL